MPNASGRVLRDPDRDAQHRVEHNVLHRRCTQHDSCKGGSRDPEIHHHPRDRRDARDRDGCGEDITQSPGGMRRSFDALDVHEVKYEDRRSERQQDASKRDRGRRAPLAAAEEHAELGTGGEHQEDDAKFFERAQYHQRRAA